MAAWGGIGSASTQHEMEGGQCAGLATVLFMTPVLVGAYGEVCDGSCMGMSIWRSDERCMERSIWRSDGRCMERSIWRSM